MHSGCCYGLQADGDLLCTYGNSTQILFGKCVGFVGVAGDFLSITKDGRLDCVKTASSAITDSTVADWNLFD
jgi:hypothetical protein